MDEPVDELAHSTTSLNLMAKSVAPTDGPPLHTRFLPASEPIRDRHFWLLHTLTPHGTVYIDHGCHKALMNKAGLLPVGVIDVEGNFAQHEPVRIVVTNRLRAPGPDGRLRGEEHEEVGRALVNYASPEIHRIMGHHSDDIRGILGYADSDYVSNRSHIVLYTRSSRPTSPADK